MPLVSTKNELKVLLAVITIIASYTVSTKNELKGGLTFSPQRLFGGFHVSTKNELKEDRIELIEFKVHDPVSTKNELKDGRERQRQAGRDSYYVSTKNELKVKNDLPQHDIAELKYQQRMN